MFYGRVEDVRGVGGHVEPGKQPRQVAAVAEAQRFQLGQHRESGRASGDVADQQVDGAQLTPPAALLGLRSNQVFQESDGFILSFEAHVCVGEDLEPLRSGADRQFDGLLERGGRRGEILQPHMGVADQEKARRVQRIRMLSPQLEMPQRNPGIVLEEPDLAQQKTQLRRVIGVLPGHCLEQLRGGNVEPFHLHEQGSPLADRVTQLRGPVAIGTHQLGQTLQGPLGILLRLVHDPGELLSECR